MLVVALLAALAVTWATAPAKAATVSCGDTISQTTKLTADLDCSGLPVDAFAALTVVGSAVTLDLNGHTLRGPNDPARAVRGVYVGGTGITVQGGTITGFDTDVWAASAGVVLKRLTLTDAARGAYINDQDTVTRSTIARVDVGIESEADGERITDNQITADGRAGDPACAQVIGGGRCIAIFLLDGGGALIRNNTISSLGAGIYFAGRSVGGESVLDNRVTCPGSGAARSGIGCIDFNGSPGGNVLVGNSVTALISDGIKIGGQSGDTVAANSVGGTTDGSGIVLLAVNDSTVRDNLATDNGDAFGNGGYGLFVSGDGNLIKRNIASRNAIDGIFSSGASTLVANVARDNGGLGIEAVNGAIDGGRNRASGNADPQCLGVTCTP